MRKYLIYPDLPRIALTGLFIRLVIVLLLTGSLPVEGMTIPCAGIFDNVGTPASVGKTPAPPAGDPDKSGSATTVIIVRHSEKDTVGTDPHLSEAGKRRAESLSRMLAEMRIDALIVSPRLRTQETLAPVAESMDLPLTVIPLEGGLYAHVGALIDTIRTSYTGRTVLVASHSNVIPLLLKGFGIEADIEIADDEYDNVFIVTTPFQNGAAPTMVRMMISQD